MENAEIKTAVSKSELIKALGGSEVWICPRCNEKQPMFDGTWCGKNLKCNHCEEYSYYSEWRVRD